MNEYKKLPVDAGDTVYMIQDKSLITLEIESVSLVDGKVTYHATLRKNNKAESKFDFPLEDIGKSVWKDKEEALKHYEQSMV